MIDLCVITGASRGLGYEMAKILNAQGKTLLLIARGEISIAGPNVFTCEADLSKIEAIATVMQMFEQLLDVNNLRSVSLLNNAGAVEPITFAEKCSATDTFNAISLNLSAVIQLSCGFLERTNNLACPRKILNISSGAATSAYRGWSHYCAAKAGVDHFTRCVGEEQKLHRNPALIVSFAPGVIDTQMQNTIRDTSVTDFPDLARFVELKRQGNLVSADVAAKQTLQFLQRDDLDNGQKYDIRY